MEINLVLNNVRVEEVKSKVVDIVDKIEKGSLFKVANVTVNVAKEEPVVETLDESQISIFTLLSICDMNDDFLTFADKLKAHFFFGGVKSISTLRERIRGIENDVIEGKLLKRWDQKKNLSPNLPDCENDSFSSLQIPPNVIITDLLRCSERDSLSEDAEFVSNLMKGGMDTIKQAHEAILEIKRGSLSELSMLLLPNQDVRYFEQLITAWAKRFL